MSERVRDQFNAFSKEYDYDQGRPLLIPAMDYFYGAGIDLLSPRASAPRVLDLGAGTGIYTEWLRRRWPDAAVTLMDFSENMLAESRNKFAGAAGIRFQQADYQTFDFGETRYDIIISALSLHHLLPDEKKRFYGKVFSLLAPGGEFLNADLVRFGDGPAGPMDGRYDDQWVRFARKNIGEGELFDRFLKNKEVDQPDSVPVQLKWLTEAGFAVVDCVFKYFGFAVLYGLK